MVIYAAQSSALYGVCITHGDPHSVLQHDPNLAHSNTLFQKLYMFTLPRSNKGYTFKNKY